jgi:hypothetical protein
MGLLKRRLEPFIDFIYGQVAHRHLSQDLELQLKVIARQESVDYLREHMQAAMIMGSRKNLHRLAIDHVSVDGLYLELGVKKGGTVRDIANMTENVVHGFDSFVGLPEDWAGTALRKGRFSTGGKLPKVPANVRLYAGWFDDSLPKFAAEHAGPIAFAHIDCDLYSSTRTFFEVLGERIVPGTVLVFDEYFNYPNWRDHEYRAFQEFVAERSLAYDYLGFTGRGGSVALKLSSP